MHSLTKKQLILSYANLVAGVVLMPAVQATWVFPWRVIRDARICFLVNLGWMVLFVIGAYAGIKACIREAGECKSWFAAPAVVFSVLALILIAGNLVIMLLD